MTAKSPRLTPVQKKQIKRLYKEGKSRQEIANDLGITYFQAMHTLKKFSKRAPYGSKTKKARVWNGAKGYETVDISAYGQPAEPDYKALYFKAVAILAAHNLIKL